METILEDSGRSAPYITALLLPNSRQDRWEGPKVRIKAVQILGSMDQTSPAQSLHKPQRVDGRRLRSERTKQLIIEAFLSLLRDEPVMPTAVQIAERAGYSVRSIFERFPDLVALRVAATDYALAQALALAPARHVDADRHTRIRSQVETRAFTCERGVALWRVLLTSEDDSGELKLRVTRARETTVSRMELMYKPELSLASEPERRQILIALEALTDIESWARMRELHSLSFEEACQVWIGAVERLLPPTPKA